MTLDPQVRQLAVAALLLLLGPTVAIVVRVTRVVRTDLAPAGPRARWMRVLIALLTMAAAALLLRPHEHLFQGLDSSAYRLMACALEDGKSLYGKDIQLSEMPLAIRSSVLLESTLDGRLTRDRSYQITSLEHAATQPYFYPTLPLSMVGFNLICPGEVRDLFIPLVAVLLLALSFGCAAVKTGPAGAASVASLFLGTPLLVWMCRGGFAETAGACFVAIALLGWLVTHGTIVESFLMGVALAVHPSLVVLVLPLVAVMALATPEPRRSLSGLLSFSAGCLPLVGLTLWVAQPYGGLNWADQWRQLRLQPMMAAVYLALALTVIAFILLWIWRRPLFRYGRALLCRTPLGATLLALLLLGLPWILLGGVWNQRHLVGWGARDFATAFPWPFALFVVVWLLLVVAWLGDSRSRLVLGILIATLPVFFVFKGYERFGFWSQRRLTPPLLMLLPLAAWPGPRVQAWYRRRPAASWLLAAVALIACSYTIIRWPAPYRMREEAGADALLANMRQRTRAALVISDYHPFSVPLAAFPGSRCVGLNSHADAQFDAIWTWFYSHLGRRPLYWISTHPTHPGIESGVRLLDRGHLRARLPVLHSRAALPAAAATREIAMAFLEPVALTRSAHPPALDKTIVHGPLALRGAWDHRVTHCRTPDDTLLPTHWTRQESAVIGPLPPPGGSVRVECLGAAGRLPSRTAVLHLEGPWGGEGIDIPFGATAVWTTNTLMRPAGAALPDAPLTGRYALSSPAPYDPADDGIDGFPDDLGVQLHRIRLVVVTD